jgi:hypothetical protein
MVSILIASTISCNAYKKLQQIEGNKECIEQFKPHITRSLYSTQVNILSSHLSGVLFIKLMPDSSTRLVFATETGFTFFDFEFDKYNTFTVHYMLDKMNRKGVVHTLEHDFRLLLMQFNDSSQLSIYKKDEQEVYYRWKDAGEINYYITNKDCKNLLRAESTSGKKPGTTILYQPYISQLPDSVYIHHRGIKFNIALKRKELATVGD